MCVILGKCGPDDRCCSGNKHKICSEYFEGVYVSVDRFYQRDGISTVQDAVTKLYRCVVWNKMEDKMENGWGPGKGARSRGVGSDEGDMACQHNDPGTIQSRNCARCILCFKIYFILPYFRPLAQFGVVAGVIPWQDGR